MEKVKDEILTQFIHYFNFIFADGTASVVFDVLSSLEVLTLNTLPANKFPYIYTQCVYY